MSDPKVTVTVTLPRNYDPDDQAEAWLTLSYDDVAKLLNATSRLPGTSAQRIATHLVELINRGL